MWGSRSSGRTLGSTRYLNPEQWAEVDRVRAEWQANEQATGPTDRVACEAAISELYRGFRRRPPRFVWVRSPAEADALISTATGDEPGRPPVDPGGAWPPKSLVRRVRVPVPLEEEQAVAEWLAGLSKPVFQSLARTPTFPRSLHTVPLLSDYGPALYEIPRRLGIKCYTSRSARQLDAWLDVERSCAWWWAFEDLCVVSDLPTEVHLEPGAAEGTLRLHNGEGPAVLFSDGSAVHAWHGLQVPAYAVVGELTGADWLKEPDSEIQRVMAERMGYDWLLENCGAQRFATDEYGSLWRIPDSRDPRTLEQDDGPPFGNSGWYFPDGSEPEDIVLVAVENPTPEEDGSYRRRVLRVPSDQRVPRDAIGWTLGLPPGAYTPDALT